MTCMPTGPTAGALDLAGDCGGLRGRGKRWKARIPGCGQQRPYITHYGVNQPNLWYRVVCYTAAWIDIIVPYVLNLIGLIIASINGRWILKELYEHFYYPVAAIVVLAAVFDWVPRARRDTFGRGAEALPGSMWPSGRWCQLGLKS